MAKDKNAIFAFEEKVKKAIRSQGMILKNDRVLAALSGGADSTALLLSLLSLSKSLSFTLFACHVNHGIRENADRDEDFCRALCENFGVAFFACHTDVPTLSAVRGESLEMAARSERYRLLKETAGRLSCSRIATAHTLSDNAETVLFNLCTGCSADGLCGIPPVRENIIRPLYLVSRPEVEEYLAALKQDFITDETNFDENIRRNYLRRRVLPLLKELNPSLETALRRLSDSALCDRKYFEKQLPSPAEKPLSAKDIAALPPSLAQRYITRLCRENNPERRVTGAQIETILHVLQKGEGAADLENKRFVLHDGAMRFVTREKFPARNHPKEDASFHIPLKIGQNKIREDFVLVLKEQDGMQPSETPKVLKIENNVYKIYEKIFVRYDIIVASLYARNRQSRDRIRIGGMSRLLKKVFSAQALPIGKRESVPVVCDENGILCIPFFSEPRDGMTVSDGEKAIEIAFYAAIDFFKE